MLLRLEGRHRALLADLLGRTREFSKEEVDVALELIDDGLKSADDYRFWVDETDGKARGYICFGPTPMTRTTFDLYWIAVDPELKGRGIGRALVRKMEEEIAAEGARLVRVETAGLPEYEETRRFYERIGYELLARIRDFYWAGNDLCLYGHYLLQPRNPSGEVR